MRNVKDKILLVVTLTTLLLLPGVTPAFADAFSFNTGNVTNSMAIASRPPTAAFEIESADDFVLTSQTVINSATFTGLLTGGAAVSQVAIEIYRVFPNDSNVGRTSGPPTFSTNNVPTRVNSPSDIAFDDRDSAVPGDLTFTTNVLNTSFTALNSVQPGGIHPKPNQNTLGNGPVTGAEVLFTVTLTDPFLLPADHYFFVPQVLVPGGNFLWLSGTRPIVFPPGFTDLQSWTRDNTIDPDWLRVGTDIVGGTPAPTFNQAFSLSGETVPEPTSIFLLGSGLIGLVGYKRKKLFKK